VTDFRLDFMEDSDEAGLDEWDRKHAQALELLRELAARRDIPRAFVLVVAQDVNGQAGVQTIAACPNDPDTTHRFVELAVQAFATFMASFRR
jgi:hypothetical protein